MKITPSPGETPLLPIVGTLEEHLENHAIEYVLIDWSSSSKKLGVLEGIRRKRPNLRMVVIGADSNEQVMMDTIIAGARAYLDTGAGPRLVREALDVVISGSIWAPRKLLSKLIDRLLSGEDSSATNPRPHLTAREEQVLQLLLLARSNREIAGELGIEERTVKAHVGKLMRKVGRRKPHRTLHARPAWVLQAGAAVHHSHCGGRHRLTRRHA